MLAAGLTLGFGVVAGWAATTLLADEFAAARPQSLTFVGPVARAVLGLVIGSGEVAGFYAGGRFGIAFSLEGRLSEALRSLFSR